MIAHELTGIVWRKSSYSGHEACVEVAAAGGDVLVRDSRDPRGPTLAISSTAWRDFLATVARPGLIADPRTLPGVAAGDAEARRGRRRVRRARPIAGRE